MPFGKLYGFNIKGCDGSEKAWYLLVSLLCVLLFYVIHMYVCMYIYIYIYDIITIIISYHKTHTLYYIYDYVICYRSRSTPSGRSSSARPSTPR